MKMISKLAFAAVFSVGIAGQSLAAECIAPANPGGGWDFTCRTISKIMTDIGAYDGTIQVTNLAGGGGGLAFTHVVNERNEDDDLIVAASTATATRLAQNAYSGMTSDQVRFLGAIGADPGVIVVAADSPHQTLNELLDDVIANPSEHAFAGGSAAGGYDHLKVLMALKRKGFTDIKKVKYIGVDGDADAITQTIGGFTSAMTGDISGVVGFIKSGDVRVLASFTEERIPGFEDIPTAKEQGVDVIAVNWRGLYTPKGASKKSYKAWTKALDKVGKSKEWEEAMMANGLAPFNIVGSKFQKYVDGVIEEVRELSAELGVLN
jgi:putative tricarboxylic transport membrane protein